MRLALILFLTAGLAWIVLQVVGDDGADVPTDLAAPQDAANAGAAGHTGPRAALTTGVLDVTVTSRSGHVPRGAQAGYRSGLEDRLRPVDERGHVIFTDAPLGNLEVLARAPGFRPATQKRFLNAGLQLSVLLRLEKEEGEGNGH